MTNSTICKLLTGLTFYLICMSCTQTPAPPTSLDLTKNWEFYEAKTAQWYPAEVPGVIHTDLLANQLIEDPFWENNEQQLQWIGKTDWNYRHTFQLTEAQLQYQHLELDFKGLDTYAEVVLNGQELFTATNMFRSWKTSVKPLLKVGENQLEVNFRSPINYNRASYEAYPYRLPSGSEVEEPRVGSFTRKAAYHFGWDWGPRFVTSGIWRPVQLNAWNQVRIQDVYCATQSIENNTAKIVVQITIEADFAAEQSNTVQLQVDDHKRISHELKNGQNIIFQEFTVNNPKLWWCNGLGEPQLYELTVKVFQKDQLLDSTAVKYGIRTIELVNEPDSIGTSFYFKLNGKAVFMKGANYIPQDIFLPRVQPVHYQQLIQKVKAATMNMLRVWGGGIYEHDLFYELCDKNGILIWQDFMFAGSLYPNNDAFLKNVKEEVRENIIRLRNHPSIALWCGNNEIEVAWKNWGWQKQYGYSSKDSTEIWKAYKQLFHELIPTQLAELDTTRDYTATSPLSNWGTAANFNHSSMHYWGVWHGREPFENFEKNVGRFMVEYGFQSFPNLATIQTFAADTSWSLASETMKNRQKSYIGNGLIAQHIEQYYPKPQSFEAFVMLSQKVQAKGLKIAIDAHLAKQPHCMGSLLWQLNDCWPGPSWSIIDYYGRPKEAYDSVKVAFN